MNTESRAVTIIDPTRLPTAREIEAVCGRRGGQVRHAAFAKALGVHTRTIRRAYLRGVFPGAVEHGERLIVIPAHLLRLAQAYGLRGLERMVKAGLL